MLVGSARPARRGQPGQLQRPDRAAAPRLWTSPFAPSLMPALITWPDPALRPDLPRGGVQPDHAIRRAGRVGGLPARLSTLGKAGSARSPAPPSARCVLGPIRTDLMAKRPVSAWCPSRRGPGTRYLKRQAGGLCSAGLVQLQPMPGAVVQQRRGRIDRQPVGGIRRRPADTDLYPASALHWGLQCWSPSQQS